LKSSKKTEKQEKLIEIKELPDALKVLFGIFEEKNPDIELKVREIKKAEDVI